MLTFTLGVLSSLVASVIYLKATQAQAYVRWSYPRGIRFMRPHRDRYLQRIAGLIRTNRERFFFKGFTGFDLLSAEVVKSALENTPMESWKQIEFVLTDPESDAFVSEENRYYTQDHLAEHQLAVREYLTQRLLPQIKLRPGAQCGLYSLAEKKNLFNCLLLDDEMFFFIRGFSSRIGAEDQIIVNVTLSKCPPPIGEFVLFVTNYWTRTAALVHAPVG